jgi:hypothetical protein
MKKDLLIQKMVKIAKTQQILLKKLANFDDLPSNYDEKKHNLMNLIKRKLAHHEISDGEPTIYNMLRSYDDLEGLAEGNNMEEFAQYYPGWKPKHFQKLLEDLNTEFNNLISSLEW